MTRRTINLAGHRFGKWSVLHRMPANGVNTRWMCRCDCGRERDVAAHSLQGGQSASCGCMQRRQPKAVRPEGWKRPRHTRSPRPSRRMADVVWLKAFRSLVDPASPPRIEAPRHVHRILDDELEAA